MTQEQIEAARTGLSAKAAGDAEAAFEAEKARVGEARRTELEAQLAAAAEAAATAAAEAEVGNREHERNLQDHSYSMSAWCALWVNVSQAHRSPAAV